MVSASECKSEDSGFDPLLGRGEGQLFSVPPSLLSLVQTCLFACTACTTMCAHVQDSTSICRKTVVIKCGNTETLHAHRGNTKLGSAVLQLLAFPGKKHPEFPVHCTGTKKVIETNLTRGQR